jgi:hypothetical protein
MTWRSSSWDCVTTNELPVARRASVRSARQGGRRHHEACELARLCLQSTLIARAWHSTPTARVSQQGMGVECGGTVRGHGMHVRRSPHVRLSFVCLTHLQLFTRPESRVHSLAFFRLCRAATHSSRREACTRRRGLAGSRAKVVRAVWGLARRLHFCRLHFCPMTVKVRGSNDDDPSMRLRTWTLNK